MTTMGMTKTLDRFAAWINFGLVLPELCAAQAVVAATGILRAMRPEDDNAGRAANVALGYSKVLQTSIGLALRHGAYGSIVNKVARRTNYEASAELAAAFLAKPGAKLTDIMQFVQSMAQIGKDVMGEEDGLPDSDVRLVANKVLRSVVHNR